MYVCACVRRYVPVGETRATLTFRWLGFVKHAVYLCIDGWGAEDLMLADQEAQSFWLVVHLPAGRYTYR